jgi:hypothetical protein
MSFSLPPPLVALAGTHLSGQVGACVLNARWHSRLHVAPTPELLSFLNPGFLSCYRAVVLHLQAHTWAGKEDPVFETLAGTPGYMCPEIMEGFTAC